MCWRQSTRTPKGKAKGKVKGKVKGEAKGKAKANRMAYGRWNCRLAGWWRQLMC